MDMKECSHPDEHMGDSLMEVALKTGLRCHSALVSFSGQKWGEERRCSR